MTVLAFLTDPEVVRKILAHLRLPTSPPPLASARSSGTPMQFDLGEDDSVVMVEECGQGEDFGTAGSPGRSPPVRDPVAD